ncbi:major facilitator superfamily domain-containing protein [Lipomyces tetrasporus]
MVDSSLSRSTTVGEDQQALELTDTDSSVTKDRGVAQTDDPIAVVEKEKATHVLALDGRPKAFSSIDLGKLLHKIDLRFLPVLSVLYLLSFLCRGTIGNAKTFGLSKNLHLTDKEYALALTVFFFSYALFDVPANMILKKLRPSIWLPSVMVATSIVMTLTGIVQSGGGLIAARFFLGLVEAGLFPGVTYCISCWYGRNEAQFRNALFFCAASMAGAFAGLLAYGLHYMDGVGGLEGWRWIMIIEGLLTFVVAVPSYFLVQDYPHTAKFLTAKERAFVEYRLRHDGEKAHSGAEMPETSEEIDAENDAADTKPRLSYLKDILLDYRIYLHIVIFWGIACPLYSISLFLPTIILNLGYTSAKANLLTVPIYIAACILALIVAYFSDKFQKRAIFVLVSCCIMIVGFIIAAAAPVSMPGLSYAGVFIAASGVYPGFPGMVAWCSNNLVGYKRVLGVGMQVGVGSFGGAMAMNFYRPQDAPQYVLGHCINIMFVSLAMIAIGILYWITPVRTESETDLRTRILPRWARRRRS